MNNLDKIFKESNGESKKFVKLYSSYLSKLLTELDSDSVAKCIDQIEEAREKNNTIFVIGNGGSASTASHVGNDFGLVVLKNSKQIEAKSYRALALTDNMSVISATGNDSTYDNIFLDQLKVHFRKGDKLIAISASGNSPNLLEAAQWFREKGGTVIGWLGFDGGKLKDFSDIAVVVKTPKGEYAPVEDIHLVINHIIVTWVQLKIRNDN